MWGSSEESLGELWFLLYTDLLGHGVGRRPAYYCVYLRRPMACPSGS